jgi:hypothetical protein
MRSIIKNTVWVLALLVLLSKAHAQQVFENDEGAREKHFIYEVKQIDEFFERFNDDSSSFIRKVYKDRHIAYSPTRAKLIRSLFNYQNPAWDKDTINRFIEQVTDAGHPLLLNFYGDDWYAEATCLFQYNNAVIEIPLIMKIETENGGSRWVIAAVKPNSLKEDVTEIRIGGIPEHHSRFINPVSHGTNFIELARVFHDRSHLSEYCDSLFFNRRQSITFYEAIQQNRIQFIRVSHIRYHYLQASPWIFTVEYFERKELNTGWLINSLEELSPAEVALYKKKMLEE